MSSFWSGPASRSDGLHTEAELEAAAYRLVTEQVLYHSDKSSKNAYYAVESFERDFRTALAPLGVDVGVNRNLRYVYAKPRHGKSGTASVAQTIFALVLRLVYDEKMRVGDLLNDDGEVFCGLIELGEKYRILVGRPLPGRGELDSLMRAAKRWGIAKKESESSCDLPQFEFEGQPFAVVIRPAIMEVLGESALQRLSQWTTTAQPSLIEDSDTDDAEINELSGEVE